MCQTSERFPCRPAWSSGECTRLPLTQPFTPQPLPTGEELSEARRSSWSPPVSLSVSFVRTSGGDGNALRCLLAAQADPSDFIGEMHTFPAHKRSFVACGRAVWPRSYLRCTNKSGGLRLSPVQCCPFPACLPPRSFLLAVSAQTRLLINMPC